MEVVAGNDKELLVRLAKDEGIREAADEYPAQSAMHAREQFGRLRGCLRRRFGGAQEL